VADESHVLACSHTNLKFYTVAKTETHKPYSDVHIASSGRDDRHSE
jgi:beta-galactosidase beta subunit